MLLIHFCFDICSILNEKNNLYFYVVWFLHALWLVQPAVFDGSGHSEVFCLLDCYGGKTMSHMLSYVM